MRSNITAHTRDKWEELARNGDLMGVVFMNNENAARERRILRYPIAYKQEEMQDFLRIEFQKLANFLGKTIYATGSSIRGYFRTPQVEEEIAKKYNLKLKYSDLDFKCDEATDEEIEKANKELNPIGKYQRCNWERYIEFKPEIKNYGS